MSAKTLHPIFFKSLPKVELHRHLEGSWRFSTLLEVARTHKLDLPYDDIDDFRRLVQIHDKDYPFTFQNFLSKFDTLRLMYRSPEIIHEITRQAIADAAADNIHYLELRFTPVALTRIKGFPIADAMDWVIEASAQAAADFSIGVKLIASVNRHESVALAEEVLKLSIDRKDKGIVALDLAGGEVDFPGDSFAGIFNEAKQSGLNITIHAGEWGGPENIKLAIETLNAERIGHGVRILEDENVVALAKERDIVLEVCPTSNYQSGVVKRLSNHPLKKICESGIKVTINTDDPGISQIDLSDEYEVAVQTLGFSLEQLQESILIGAQAAFLPDVKRKLLVEDLTEEFEKKNGQ